MSTKQIVDVSISTTSTSARRIEPEVAVPAEDPARELLAKARYDAFRLLTEAREEAETILREARAESAGILKAAQIASDSTTEATKQRADKTIVSATTEAAAIVARAHREAGESTMHHDTSALEAEHQALTERVSTLRDVAERLEARFAALVRTTDKSPDTLDAGREQSDASTQPPSSTKPQTNVDYSPSVEPSKSRKPSTGPVASAPRSATDTDEADGKKDSFYHRRSARLPRLGEEGGRSTFEMTRSMRELLDTK